MSGSEPDRSWFLEIYQYHAFALLRVNSLYGDGGIFVPFSINLSIFGLNFFKWPLKPFAKAYGTVIQTKSVLPGTGDDPIWHMLFPDPGQVIFAVWNRPALHENGENKEETFLTLAESE